MVKRASIAVVCAITAIALVFVFAVKSLNPARAQSTVPVTLAGNSATAPAIVQLSDGAATYTGAKSSQFPTAAIAASTANAYTNGALSTAQRPTTVATAPTNGNLTAATATQVSAGGAGICQVAIQNRDSTIHMFCGQTNAVSLTIGFDVAPGTVYTSSAWYGGTIFCFPASGTPAFSAQVTSCP